MAIELDSATQCYVAAAQKEQRLSRDEELELWRRWHEHQDDRARDALIRANLRYVVAIAFKYRYYGLSVGDLIAEGNVGIMRALARFQPERGNRFITYASYWIRAFVLSYVINSRSLVGAGSGVLRSSMFFKLRRESVRATNLWGEGGQATAALAERLNVSQERVTEMLERIGARDVSLNSSVSGAGGVTLMDTLVSSHTSPEDNYARSQQQSRTNQFIREALRILDRRERFIVEHCLMPDREESHSLAEAGRRLGVSRERARQLEARAKRKLARRFRELSDASELDALSARAAE